MARNKSIEYIVFNDCTLLNRGIDSSWVERRKALQRIKKLIKSYLKEWKKGEDYKFKSEEDKHLWALMSSEMSFKKLETIYLMVEKIYRIDLKSMIYIVKA